MENAQNETKGLGEALRGKTFANDGHRHVERGLPRQFVSEAGLKGEAFSTSPSYAELPIGALEIADKENAKVHFRRDARADFFLVGWCKLLLGGGVKAGGCENLIEFKVEKVFGALRMRFGGKENPPCRFATRFPSGILWSLYY